VADKRGQSRSERSRVNLRGVFHIFIEKYYE
jgi:hypothetical protein